jgi:hypothetical protein
MATAQYEFDRCSSECDQVVHDLAPGFLLVELTAPMSQCTVEPCTWCDGKGTVQQNNLVAPKGFTGVPCMRCMGIGFRERYDPNRGSEDSGVAVA